MFDVRTFAKGVTTFFRNCYNFFKKFIAFSKSYNCLLKKSYVKQIGHNRWPVYATCYNFWNFMIFSKVGSKF